MSAAARIVFAGTPHFAVPSLQQLMSTGAQIPVVLTRPDRPAGRGRKPAPSPIKREALARGLEVCQPEALQPGVLDTYVARAPDLLIVVAYGLLLPGWLLQWPRLGAVNVHASLLPRWRGASPIQHAILAGDEQTGVSVMQMDAGLDTGPVFGRNAVTIRSGETAGELHDRLACLGAQLLGELLPAILDGVLTPAPQQPGQATYAPRINKAEAPLDWTRPAAELERRVRAFNPWPVSETATRDGRRLRIWEAVALEGSGGAPAGSVVAADRRGIDVATGEGVLRIVRLQPPGGTVMSAQAYLNAHRLRGAALVSPT